MKKFTLALLAIVFALFVVSCGDSKKDDPTDTTPDTDTPDTDTPDTDTDTDTPDTDEPDTDEPDTDQPAACKIDDAYNASQFDNFYAFKGSGIINDENADDVDMTTMTKTSIYLEDHPDYNLKMTQSYFLNATLTNGMKSVVLIGMGYASNGYPNLQIQAIIPDQWFEAIDELTTEYPDDFDRAPFAPMINVAALDLHVKGQQIEWYKMCTIAINTYAPVEIAQGDMPEGSFQYCYGKDGTYEPGQTFKLGLDAKLTDKFEDIQAAYNEGVEEGAEGYVATEADLCTCISFESGDGKEIECPAEEEPTEPTEPTTEPLTCDAAAHKELNEAGDACVCMEGYTENETTHECEAAAPALTCDAAAHKELNAAGDACVCMEGYTENETTHECEAAAPALTCDAAAHKELNAAGDACVCVIGYNDIEGVCRKQCTSNSDCVENEESCDPMEDVCMPNI